MQTRIPVQERFRKSWNEAQVIVTHEDIAEYENSKKQICVPHTETKNSSESQIKSRLNTNDMDNEHTRKEILQKRLMDLQNSLLQFRMVEQRLQIPKKQCGNACAEDSNFSPRSVMSTASSENFNWIIPSYSVSKSLPSSPVGGTLPNTTFSPTVPTSPHGHFSFIPENLRFLEESEYLSEAHEIDNGFRQTQGCFDLPQGKFSVRKLLSI